MTKLMLRLAVTATAFGLFVASGGAQQLPVQKSGGWTVRPYDKDPAQLHNAWLGRYQDNDCFNSWREDWKLKWESISKESMDKCEYKKVTELIENNERVLRFEYCRVIWQRIRHYRAKYAAEAIGADLEDQLLHPFPRSWSEVAGKGAEKALGRASGVLGAAATGVSLLDLKEQWDTEEESEALYSRYNKTYSHHETILKETKRYWEVTQRKLLNCPPVTTSSGGGKKQPATPGDPAPPEPVKTGAKTSPGGSAVKGTEIRSDLGKGGGGALQAAVPPADPNPPAPPKDPTPVPDDLGYTEPSSALENTFVFTDPLECTDALDYSVPAPTVGAEQQAACDQKVLKAATKAADTAAAWALGKQPGGAGDTGKPKDPVAFWGDACHAMLELSSRFRPPGNRDPRAAIDHSRRRAEEAIALALGLGKVGRNLESLAENETAAVEEALAKAAKARKNSPEARKLTNDARKAAERAAAAHADAAMRELLGWRLEDVGFLYLAHAKRVQRTQASQSAAAGDAPPINPNYCAQRINYIMALNRPGGGSAWPGGAAGYQPGQLPAGSTQPTGAGQPGATTQSGAPGYTAGPYGRTDPGAVGGSQQPSIFGGGAQRYGGGAPSVGTFGGAPGGTVLGTQPGGKSTGSPTGTMQRPSTLSDELLKQGGGKSGGTTR